MPLIKETYHMANSNTDILSAPSRLTSIPAAGLLTIEASTTDCDGTNFGTLTLQLPGGEIPFEDLIIPHNGLSTGDSVMDTDTELIVQIPVDQGGHVLLQYTENGTVALCLLIASFEY